MCVQSVAPITSGKSALAANWACWPVPLHCMGIWYTWLMWIILFHQLAWLSSGLTGTVPISWPAPSGMPVLLGSPVWSAPIGTGSTWPFAVLRFKTGCSSTYSSKKIALGYLKQLMSQSSLCATKSSRTLNMRSLWACFYICRHVDVLIVHQCVSDVHITLWSNCFHTVNSFPAQSLNVRMPAMKSAGSIAHVHVHFTLNTSERERGKGRTPRFSSYAPFVH